MRLAPVFSFRHPVTVSGASVVHLKVVPPTLLGLERVMEMLPPEQITAAVTSAKASGTGLTLTAGKTAAPAQLFAGGGTRRVTVSPAAEEELKVCAMGPAVGAVCSAHRVTAAGAATVHW